MTNAEIIANTKKRDQKIARAAAERAYAFPRYTFHSLWDAYGKPSENKVRAWDYCKRLCAEMGGFDMVISSRNSMVFSVVFKFADNETGELCYAYITRDYDRFCHAS